MKMRAAVCREHGKPISVEEVHLAPPKANEVLVKTKFTGYCHSDFSAVESMHAFPKPLVIGHEASGVVEEVGAGVTALKRGDRVAATWMVPCGRCEMCVSGRPYICTHCHTMQPQGALPDGTSRLTDAKGARLNHHVFVSGFAEYMVLPEGGAIKIPDALPLDQACFLGCCMPTGYGAVLNVAQVRTGDSVAIFGVGGVGLNVVQGAKLRAGYPIIAVDLNGKKESAAREFGATHFIDSSVEDPVPKIQEITGGGAKFCFEAAGDPGAIVQAYWSLGIGGTLIQAGIPPMETTTPLPLTLTPPHNRNILGTLYGNVRIAYDLPRFMDMILRGDYIDLAKLIGRKFKLEEINDVHRAMANHEIIGRWVCEFD